MEINWSLVLGSFIPLVALSLIMSRMASNRGMSPIAWAAIAFLPLVNLLGLVVLALKPREAA